MVAGGGGGKLKGPSGASEPHQGGLNPWMLQFQLGGAELVNTKDCMWYSTLAIDSGISF